MVIKYCSNKLSTDDDLKNWQKSLLMMIVGGGGEAGKRERFRVKATVAVTALAFAAVISRSNPCLPFGTD